MNWKHWLNAGLLWLLPHVQKEYPAHPARRSTQSFMSWMPNDASLSCARTPMGRAGFFHLGLPLAKTESQERKPRRNVSSVLWGQHESRFELDTSILDPSQCLTEKGQVRLRNEFPGNHSLLGHEGLFAKPRQYSAVTLKWVTASGFLSAGKLQPLSTFDTRSNNFPFLISRLHARELVFSPDLPKEDQQFPNLHEHMQCILKRRKPLQVATMSFGFH